MKALIIEDELLSRRNLENAIARMFDDIEIVGARDSVVGTLAFLREHGAEIDIIFMDVELSDGTCFDIFAHTEIRAQVIITTAYDTYAIRAFEVNSIDYLLKPIDPAALRRAVDRCRQALEARRPQPAIDVEALRSALAAERPRYRQRFVVHVGDKILVISTSDVAYIHAEEKSTCLTTTAGKRYIVDQTLNALAECLDPERFFRISRGCIVSIGAIASIARSANNRMTLTLQPKPDFEVAVSRFRTNEFLDWLESK